MAKDAPSLGARIRRARERAQLSQEELAKRVGASVRAVGDWENDRRKPRNRLGALEDVLGVSLRGEPEEPKPPKVRPEILREMYADIRAANSPEDAELMIANIEAALRGDPPPLMRTGGEEQAAAG